MPRLVNKHPDLHSRTRWFGAFYCAHIALVWLLLYMRLHRDSIATEPESHLPAYARRITDQPAMQRIPPAITIMPHSPTVGTLGGGEPRRHSCVKTPLR